MGTFYLHCNVTPCSMKEHALYLALLSNKSWSFWVLILTLFSLGIFCRCAFRWERAGVCKIWLAKSFDLSSVFFCRGILMKWSVDKRSTSWVCTSAIYLWKLTKQAYFVLVNVKEKHLFDLINSLWAEPPGWVMARSHLLLWSLSKGIGTNLIQKHGSTE